MSFAPICSRTSESLRVLTRWWRTAQWKYRRLPAKSVITNVCVSIGGAGAGPSPAASRAPVGKANISVRGGSSTPSAGPRPSRRAARSAAHARAAERRVRRDRRPVLDGAVRREPARDLRRRQRVERSRARRRRRGLGLDESGDARREREHRLELALRGVTVSERAASGCAGGNIAHREALLEQRRCRRVS